MSSANGGVGVGTAVFGLPTAWRATPGVERAERVERVEQDEHAEHVKQVEHVEYADLVDGLTALAGICGTERETVLLAAHIKVLGMLGEADDRHTEVDLGTGVHRLPVLRTAATWQELVLRVAKAVRSVGAGVQFAVRQLGSADEVSYGERVLFVTDASTRATNISYGLEVAVAGTKLTLTAPAAAIAPPYPESLRVMYREVLEAMAADPDGDALAARLAPRDRESLLGEWSAGATADRGARTVGALIEAQVARTPDAPAVRIGGTELSYRELDARANRIARRLTALGARPDALVGVCLRRTPDLLPALLGVWKSGAGYLPLDPSLPAERLQHMITAAGCELVISETAHVAVLRPRTAGGATGDGDARAVEGGQLAAETVAPGRPAAPDLVLLDRDREALDALSPEPLGMPPADPRSLAYVIYTSGSTGDPKGVMVEHAGLANYLLWTVEAYAARGTGGAPVFSSISFDLGMPSLFAPLLTGQPVHLLPDPLDTADLGDQLVAGAPYSFIKMTPGHLDLLSYDLTPDEIHDLAGLVIAAGDAFTSELARRWIEFAGPGGTAVATEYGPTEITVGNSGETLAEPPATELIPLGAPIPNTTMYVLTDRLEPVPVGVPGEVFIGGAGVARGYLDRPALTAERFLPDPFGAPGARLYRTGDRARRRADGSLEFLGRVDHQVKIRGYRVELGEIQARLRDHRSVAEAVVIAVGTARSRSLAAYVIPADGQRAEPAELRDHLAAVLPGYMIPAHFVAIDQVPLTTNGKVDTRALQSLL
ncbi:amino acid adenylation domain-containing protein [Streptomyces lincolnensis]|uniref:amino acid adenylation domain-containing protein n=1 Tax=Streptomyces lincolnensis TaxID=1915 RepID=UPI0037D13331